MRIIGRTDMNPGRNHFTFDFEFIFTVQHPLIGDVILILRYVVMLDTPTPEQAAAADFNLTGAPDIGDVVNALRIVVGLPPVL